MALLYAKASDGYLASIPLNVMGYTQNIRNDAYAGYQVLPSSLILQWGSISYVTDGNMQLFQLSVNYIYSVIANDGNTASSDNRPVSCVWNSSDLTGFHVYSPNNFRSVGHYVAICS